MSEPGGVFGGRATRIATVVSAVVGVLALIVSIVALFPRHPDPEQPAVAHPLTAPAAAAPTSTTPAPPRSDGAEWTGSIRLASDAAVDVDATPPYVDPAASRSDGNDLQFEGDGPYLNLIGYDGWATLWKDAAPPTEGQCRAAVERSHSDHVTIRTGAVLCLRTLTDTGRHYELLEITSVSTRTLVGELTRWPELSFRSSQPPAPSTGRGTVSLTIWTVLARVALIALGVATGITETPGPALVALAVLVVWLVIVWSSMAWWLVLLLVLLDLLVFAVSSIVAASF